MRLSLLILLLGLLKVRLELPASCEGLIGGLGGVETQRCWPLACREPEAFWLDHHLYIMLWCSSRKAANAIGADKSISLQAIRQIP